MTNNMTGLYVHVPFCAKKCSYCDFVSFGGRQDSLPSYLCALKNEARQYAGQKIDTVYFGGGTPSVLSSEQAADLIEFLKGSFNIVNNAEITFECNPASVTKEKLQTLKKLGVNRISIGAQSLSDSVLDSLGRAHTLTQFEQAVELTRETGIENFNFDLIFALPSQTLSLWQQTVNKAIKYAPNHISCYSLTLSENTPMGKLAQAGKLDIPSEEEERQMYHYLIKTLEQEGIKQYEVSNFARQGSECIHNINYWQCGEYIGLGCAAHSYFKGARWHNTEDLDKYILLQDIVCEREELSQYDKKLERIMLGFRMNDGIDVKRYNVDFESDFFSEYTLAIDKCKDFLIIKKDKLALNKKGFDILDTITLEFIK